MRDYIVQDQKQKERERFIASIDEESVVKLASSFHNNDGGRISGTKNGAFNVCFFVEFVPASASGHGERPDRWVVRIPIPGRVYWAEENVEVEVATMKHVAANTSIPVPKIQAYSLSSDNPVGTPFIIMDYVDGRTLGELGLFPRGDAWVSSAFALSETKRRVLEQLADVYVQLRRQEFPRIGALGLPDQQRQRPAAAAAAAAVAADTSIRVCHRPISVEVILQTDEGYDPTARFFRQGATFGTASEYADALLWLAENELAKGRNSWVDVREGRKILYAMSDFARFVRERWLDPASGREKGPFVLMHGDLSVDNLLWDDQFNLRAVLDWERSCVVPLQFLVPPVWLTGSNNAATLTHFRFFYNMEVRHFRAVVRDRERALGLLGPPFLSEEWAAMDKFCHTLVVSALFRPEYIYDVYWNFLSPELTRAQQSRRPPGGGDAGEYEYGRIISARLEAFMDDAKEAVLQKKRQEQAEYSQAEKRHFNEYP